MNDAPNCERCGSPVPSNRRRYDRTCCAKYAAVLRYRERLGEDYLLLDSARKRIARHGRKLRVELGPPASDSRIRRRIASNQARKEHDAIRRDFFYDGPTPELANRAASLVASLRPWETETDPTTWADCLELRVNMGTARNERYVLDKLLKQIELVRIEQHDHAGLARILTSRLSLYYQLVHTSYDGLFEEAVKLDRYLAALFDGPLRRSRESLAITWVEYCYRLLRLRLALLGRLNTVQRRYDELHEFSDSNLGCWWYTSLEGIRMYMSVRNFRDAEKCFVDAIHPVYCPPPPAEFNEMREHRTAVIFYLALRDRDSAYKELRDFAELVGEYQTVGDGQFWRRVAPLFGLPVEMPYNDERLVLYPNLARNE